MVGAIVLQQIWGNSFYHWMIECLPRLASLQPHVLSNSSVALLVTPSPSVPSPPPPPPDRNELYGAYE